MGQKKLIRFAELKNFPNVLQYPEDMKGKWKKFFQNENQITLELACGKGEYAVGLMGSLLFYTHTIKKEIEYGQEQKRPCNFNLPMLLF